MAINPTTKPHSLTHISNLSWDDDNQLIVNEIVGVDPNGVVRKVPVTVDGKLAVDATVSIDTTGLATDTNQTNGSQKTQIVDAGGEAVTVTGGKLDVNATASLAGQSIPATGATEAVTVQIVDGSGNQITTFGGGVQYTEGDTEASITGTAAVVEGAADALAVLTQPLTDTQLRATAVPISAASLPLPTGAATEATQLLIQGDIEAQGGDINNISNEITDLNTKIPVLGQALEAASVPVVLPAGQITALTPPAAITGFATSAKQDNLLNEIYVLTGAMAMQVDDAGSGTLYQGWAEPGTATSAASWRIRKVVSSGTPEDTVITWADGDRSFNNVWNNHTSLSYS